MSVAQIRADQENMLAFKTCVQGFEPDECR